MISRTLSTGSPYSSRPSMKVRYFVTASVVSMIDPPLRRRGRRHLPDEREQPAHVENQPDAAVAQDGATGDAADAAKHFPEALDDDFLLAEQVVDGERDGPPAVFR